ncbi:hypothetical protein BG846_02768 [Streptomyces fradiae ATCC 10745 = DSM 40063]|uniref:Uncharacterized protein n=1 Tax=Streptomyces fradiae ATCC 10745 = DSM 40063 TaxID=1319510 RepID=A0A1Y2NWZ5_STRFR|nr:hypothetical protein BG846_02768 [Streptomyces fradiae ATCC 10745 = DSM 40063]
MTDHDRSLTMPAPPEHVLDQAAGIGRREE